MPSEPSHTVLFAARPDPQRRARTMLATASALIAAAAAVGALQLTASDPPPQLSAAASAAGHLEHSAGDSRRTAAPKTRERETVERTAADSDADGRRGAPPRSSSDTDRQRAIDEGLVDPDLVRQIETRAAERAAARQQRDDSWHRQQAHDATQRRTQVLRRGELRQAQERQVGAVHCDTVLRHFCDQVDADLSRHASNWTALGWGVVVTDERADDWYAGLAWHDTRTIEMYPRDSWTTANFSHILWHEFGHAVDVERWTDADRAAWSNARRIDPTSRWQAGGGPHNHDVGAEDLAEAFAQLYALDPAHNRSFFGPAGDEIDGLRPLLPDDLR